MVSPAPVDPPGQVARQMHPGSPGGDTATRRFLDNFGIHLLIVLLGIALAFM
jgi:hypothetical protein